MARPVMRTFLFSDLRDYTAFTETKGDQAATTMLRASRRIVRAAVAKHRGAEIKTEGDSFYVVFRSPSPAVQCAIDIQRGTARHNERHPDLPVRMGVGINTGEAVPHDKGYVGSAVIIANRLSVSCAAGQIVITDTVRSLVRTGAHAAMRELGGWTLKGVAEMVRVYDVGAETTTAARSLRPSLSLPAMLASHARPVPGLVVCPELVGREQPLAALAAHLEAASHGETRIVAVSGEGGVGKTRLVRAIAERAHRDGMYVFGGRSHVSGAPYEPFVAALRPYAQARGTEILRRQLGGLVGELRRLLPEVDLGRATVDPDIPTDERRDRFLRTISLLLEDAAAQRPVLLVLEDFHDADEASRDVLRHLASSFHAGMCVLFSYREEEVTAAHPLRAFLSELERDRRLARVALAPLDAAGVERMTAALVPGRETSVLARAVYRRSQGIPFYVEELLKTALDDPNGKADEALPASIADSVRLRVSRLAAHRGSGVTDLLEVTAVAEVPLGYDTLVRLSGRPEAEAGADLAAAIDAQLLERPATRTELYQYRHALTREAVAASIAPARRRRLHARVAAAIEALGDTSTRASLLARHFAAAGDRAKALTYTRQGAANAVRVGAYATAIELLRGAVAMASATPEEPNVLEELAEALEAAGRANEAEDALARARELTVDVAALARIQVRLASVLRIQGRRAQALEVVKSVVAALEGTPGPLLARALLTQAELATAEYDLEETVRMADRALAVARESGARGVELEALCLLGAAANRLGRDDGIGHIEQAVDLSHEWGLEPQAATAYLELARARLWWGHNEEALDAGRAGIEIARARGLDFLHARLLAVLTTIGVNLGRYGDARSFAEQAVAVAWPGTVAAFNAKISLAHVISDQGEGAAALGLYDEVRRDLHRQDPERQAIYWAYSAQALLGEGKLEEAAASARAAVDLTLALPGQGMTAFLNAAEVMEARADRAGIADLATKFETYFAGRDSPYIRFTRAEISAISALCEGRPDADAFDRAAELYKVVGARVRTTYRRATAAALRAGPRPSRESAELRRLRNELETYGAMRYVRLLDAMRARRPSSWLVGPARPGEVVRAN